jgi:hypothetical protein
VKLLDALLPGREVTRYVPPAWMDLFPISSLPGYTTSYGVDRAEPIGDSFSDYVLGGLQGNGVVWSIERVRLSVFCEARFQFQQIRKGRPGDLFGTADLQILEEPWEGGTTGDLLARMILDADFAGNFFAVEMDGEIIRLRPDWVEVVLTERYDGMGRQVGWKRLGYLYYEGGKSGARRPCSCRARWCTSHRCPIRSRLAGHVVADSGRPGVMADTMTTKHKLKFFENAATPNLAVSLPKETVTGPVQGVRRQDGRLARRRGERLPHAVHGRRRGRDRGRRRHAATRLQGHPGRGRVPARGRRRHPPGDRGPVRGSARQLAQRGQLRGGAPAGRGRDDAAAVAQRRRFAGGPRVAAGRVGRLWYDARDVAFLREDARDEAEIMRIDAQTVVNLVRDGGFTNDSAKAAVLARNVDLLVPDPDWISVQLQAKTRQALPPAAANGTEPANAKGGTP